MAAWMEPSLNMDKLSHEIFSILETKFLFGYDDAALISLAGTPPETPAKLAASGVGGPGKVRILSIDGSGASDGLLAAAALARLETSLRRRSGDPSARIADFFDLAAGSGPGGVLAALLFSSGPDGRPLFSADEALEFLSRNQKEICKPSRSGIFGKRGGIFRRVFGDLTVKEAMKPLLIPCHDLQTGAGFMFSRADAVEMDGYDFFLKDACSATSADNRTVRIASVDGRTKISAVGAGAAGAGNPTAAAITHVLNNKQEFPRAAGVEDLLVLSLGGGRNKSQPSKSKTARIASDSAADTVDQAVGMAFGQDRTANYVRIQANELKCGKTREAKLRAVENALSERNVEMVLFKGNKLSEQSNAEKMEVLAGDIIREDRRRKLSVASPTVMIKQAMTPRTSSATTLTSSSAVTSSSL